MRYVALLRAVNLGKRNVAPMKQVVAGFEKDLGFTNVSSYLQTGNVVFESSLRSECKIEKLIEDWIEGNLGFNTRAGVRSASEMGSLVEEVGVERGRTDEYIVFATFLIDDPGPLPELKDPTGQVEVLRATSREVVCKCRLIDGRYGDSALFLGKSIKVPTTTRTWAVVQEVARRCG